MSIDKEIKRCELCDGNGFVKSHSSDGISYIFKPCLCGNISRVKIKPKKSKRGDEWIEFSFKVLNHVEAYTVPQYGDTGEDNVTNWSAEDCVKQIEKYQKRFGKNSRPGQEKLDLLKIAHYACLAASKLDDNRHGLV